MTEEGHEDQFPPRRLSACCGFGQETFAGGAGNGQDAPIPAVGRAAMEPARFERSWRLPEGREIELLDGLERTIMSRD